MKNDLLSDAVGKIDEDLIENADKENPAKRKAGSLRWISAAAAAFLVAAGVFAAVPALQKKAPPLPADTVGGTMDPGGAADPERSSGDTTVAAAVPYVSTADTAGMEDPEASSADTTETEPPVTISAGSTEPAVPEDPSRDGTAAEPVSDPDVTTGEMFVFATYEYRIEDGAYSSYVQGRVIEDGRIGMKIGDAQVIAGWVRNGVWEKNEHARAVVYEISGVSPDTAVAIRFLDKLEAETTEFYYVLINPAADPAPVAEYRIVPISDASYDSGTQEYSFEE